ncbi:TetR/AcrR family transcriptional regulator [Streptomyces jeddahensis]|uniref:Tetracycline repressor protein class H n=1 Tax=Streptomyces jeddahensis TaxID=1716141 RepID=A0A177HWW8_9ACTN|nr:TetR/AcrR family transcriptional regulator [Streptomyces jeddahensis]OAH15385.1 tetracycline repressor protein class H [Streptomyces jeddahensis]
MINTSKREAILDAALDLLTRGGRDAVSTRALCSAAGVQAPTIYRLFGDKQGVLDAVASRGLESYLADKRHMPPSGDPVEDLRRGWDLHIGFGLAEPTLYSLIYGSPRPGAEPEGAKHAAEILAGLVHRVALAGQLRISEERAARVIHAAGRGTTLTLIATPDTERDMGVSRITREAVIHAITHPAPVGDDRRPADESRTGSPRAAKDQPQPRGADAGVGASAVALKAALADVKVLSPSERQLLGDWLDRIINAVPD